MEKKYNFCFFTIFNINFMQINPIIKLTKNPREICKKLKSISVGVFIYSYISNVNDAKIIGIDAIKE